MEGQMYDLNRFIKAQQHSYEQVVEELERGRKSSHWMWYIFPQIDGLGHSTMAKHFALSSLEEAREYLEHPLLGNRLRQCTDLVLHHSGIINASQLFGSIDAMKFRSSMTLFAIVEPDGIFTQALEVFYNSSPDPLTLDIVDQS